MTVCFHRNTQVLFGMPWCDEILDKSSELKNRFDNIHLLDEFGKEFDSFTEWQKLLGELDNKLPSVNSLIRALKNALSKKAQT